MGNQAWTSPTTGHRRQGTRYTSLRRLFADNVTVREIYERLMCCRTDDPLQRVKSELEIRGFDTAGVVNESGRVIGFVNYSELEHGSIGQYVVPILLEQVISDSTPIASLLALLGDRNPMYVNHGDRVVGIISRADLDKPPVRIYLFGVISLMEMHLDFWISHEHEDTEWGEKISDKRLQNASVLLDERRKNNSELNLLNCLQLADKRDILSKTPDFLTRLELSKNGFVRSVKHLESARNELAHSQASIVGTASWSRLISAIEFSEKFLERSDDIIEQLAVESADEYVDFFTAPL